MDEKSDTNIALHFADSVGDEPKNTSVWRLTLEVARVALRRYRR